MGRRLLVVSTDLCESILRDGVGAAEPVDVPRDIEIVKGTYSPEQRQTVFEVRSAEWPEQEKGEPLYAWAAEFRRKETERDAHEFLSGLVLGAVLGLAGTLLAVVASGWFRSLFS